LHWSPNSVDLGFLSTAANPDMLILQSVSAVDGERVILDSGETYYWTWAPDGEVMIAHVGQPPANSEHLAFLRTDPELIEDGLDWQPAVFQTPAWSPTGEHILFAEAGANGENQIVLADSAGGSRRSVGSFETTTAFAWAFDGTKFAYIAREQQTPLGLAGALHIVNLADSTEIVQERPISAFFWSPDGTQIAYFVPVVPDSSDQGETQGGEPIVYLELSVIDVETGESHVIAPFQPTEQFLSILPFFDQYHRSATIWSPDSANLVISFMDPQAGPGIAVVAASGRLQPRVLAPGFLAFWSWE
jgi:Tol biopolymer transport system component